MNSKIKITAVVAGLGMLLVPLAASNHADTSSVVRDRVVRAPGTAELNRRLAKITIRNYPVRVARLSPERISAVLAPRLRELRVITKSLPRRHALVVYGHTSRGELKSRAERRRLSQLRARFVYDYLKRAGLPRLKLVYIGLGDAQPADTPARSRRVSFRVEKAPIR